MTNLNDLSMGCRTIATKLILSLLLCCFGFQLMAQQAVSISDGTVEYDKRQLPSLRLPLQAPVDAVYDPWQDFWEDRYDVDIDRSDKDGDDISYLAEQVSLPKLSSKNFDFYSNVSGGETNATVSIALAFSDTDIVGRDNHADTYAAARAVLEEFSTYFYTRYFDERIDATREALEDVRDDSASASKDAEKAREKIEKYEDKIEKLRRKIEDLRDDVGDELETADEKAKRVRDLEAELEQLQRSRKNFVG
ncbi:hypothetical protein GGR28_000797 [Lewinella aquimaris]|uniref:Uncharacterized protein n=1 Tax=Neolewinella aquimaris TaxID=1835722 RepID=A0A840EB25_9BACT|nr:hypothetical protein [Neolewinella aquimaris]MBB4078196.1 hypothetical protein [Neolewinella aquimaris]